MKNSLKKLTFISFLVIVLGLNAYSQQFQSNPKFTTEVTVPSFPYGVAIGYYAIIEITNNDFENIYYFNYFPPTWVRDDLGDKVSVYTLPNYAKVSFSCVGQDPYNGTVQAKVTVYFPNGDVLGIGYGSVTGSFTHNNNAMITIDTWNNQ